MFQLSEDQIAIRTLARDFANDVIFPIARNYGEEETFPMHLMKEFRGCGLVNIGIPEEYGGPGIDKISQALILEELARGCADLWGLWLHQGIPRGEIHAGCKNNANL